MKRLAACILGLALSAALVLSAVLAAEGEGRPRRPRGEQGGEPNKGGGQKGGGQKGGGQKGAPKAAPKAAPKGAAAVAAKGGPKKPPAKKGGGEGEEEGDEGGEGAMVLEDSDAVVLRDGTRINGTILCAGQTAVTLLTPEGEKTFPREQIERIVQNADAGLPKKFTAEELDGHKYLKDAEGGAPVAAKTGEPKGPDIVPLDAGTATPAAKGTAPAAPAAPPPAAPVATVQPAAPAGPAKVLAPVTFPKTQPELHALIEKLRKDGTLNDYLADPKFRDGFREAVREAFRNAPKEK